MFEAIFIAIAIYIRSLRLENISDSTLLLASTNE